MQAARAPRFSNYPFTRNAVSAGDANTDHEQVADCVASVSQDWQTL